MRARAAYRLLFPALRWDERTGYDHEAVLIEHALRRGVGGFIIFGGDTAAVADLTYRTQSRSDLALLFGSDLERGAGQQFKGATPLPPLAAIGSLADIGVTRQAAGLTAREALALGINWLFGPVCDLDSEPRNPIVSTRSFGSEAEFVSRHAAAWVEAAQSAGAIACAKHFPGHGRTLEDSHVVLPSVTVSRAELDLDMQPFRAAIRAGVASIMTAHVRYANLDPDQPATLSATVLDLLRADLGFEGVVVTDGIGMRGLLDAAGGDEAVAAMAALNAGCDALLYPESFEYVADAVAAAVGSALPRRSVERSAERIAALAEQNAPHWGHTADQAALEWAIEQATGSIVSLGGQPRLPPGFQLCIIDDDLGGPHTPPARQALSEALLHAGFQHEPTTDPSGARALVIALFCDVRGWKGRAGLSSAARDRLRRVLQRRPDATLLLFAHPRIAQDTGADNVVCAWGGEPLMQIAAAHWLERNATRTNL